MHILYPSQKTQWHYINQKEPKITKKQNKTNAFYKRIITFFVCKVPLMVNLKPPRGGGENLKERKRNYGIRPQCS